MIHPSAIVETSGTIADDVEIGPFAVITGDITIGPACHIESHVQILNQVSIGGQCLIGTGSVVGSDPQDLAFNPLTPSGVLIGDGNTLRELVTIHRSATLNQNTSLGDHNYLRAGAHLGHDVAVGDHNTIGNDALLGGHATVGNHSELGAGSVYHQFVRIGSYAKTPDLAGLSLDLPPFTESFAVNLLAGLNHSGLEKAGLTPAERDELTKAYHLIFSDGLNLSQALAQAAETQWQTPFAHEFIAFFKTDSKKGICSKLARS
ncbi:MAG: acyl-ACP--UDP-N-acetylglucosamine O-acyltransferase [Verrucomicrobiota bacterium]